LLRDCPFATVDQANPSAQADEAFTAGSAGPDVSETLLQYPVSVAKGQMKQFAETAIACSSFAANEQGLVLRVALVREAFPSFGDDTIALRISAVVVTRENLTIDSDVIAVRRGGTVLLVTNVGMPLNTGLSRTLVAAAYGKVPRKW